MKKDQVYFPYKFITKNHRIEYRVRISFYNLSSSLFIAFLVVGFFFVIAILAMYFLSIALPNNFLNTFIIVVLVVQLALLLIARQSIRATISYMVEKNLETEKIDAIEHKADAIACMLYLIPILLITMLVSECEVMVSNQILSISFDLDSFFSDFLKSVIWVFPLYFFTMKYQDIPFNEEFFILETKTSILNGIVEE